MSKEYVPSSSIECRKQSALSTTKRPLFFPTNITWFRPAHTFLFFTMFLSFALTAVVATDCNAFFSRRRATARLNARRFVSCLYASCASSTTLGLTTGAR